MHHGPHRESVVADRSYGDPAAVALTATPAATALKPLAPVRLAAARDGSGVTFSWIRRKRGPMPAAGQPAAAAEPTKNGTKS